LGLLFFQGDHHEDVGGLNLSEIGIDDFSVPDEEAVKKYNLFTAC
jgi:hypothetical protein